MAVSKKAEESLELCKHCGRGGLPVHNPWLLVDLDGTILETGHFPEYGPPNVGAAVALKTLQVMGFKIAIWTNRLALTDLEGKFQDANREQSRMETHLNKHGIPYDYIMPGPNKPTLFYAMVDDKAFRFTTWAQFMKDVKEDLHEKGIGTWDDKKEHLTELIL